jgi:hypothetical protein
MVMLWIIRVKFIGSGRSKMKGIERVGNVNHKKKNKKKIVRTGKEMFLKLKLPLHQRICWGGNNKE